MELPIETEPAKEPSNFEKMLAKFRGQKENIAKIAQSFNPYNNETPQQRIKRVKDQKERERKRKAQKAARKRNRR